MEIPTRLNAACALEALESSDDLKKDAKAQKAIATTISKRNQQIIMSCNSANAMYRKLCDLYEGDTEALKGELLKEYFNFRMTTDIAKGIADLENLKIRLKNAGHEIEDAEMVQRILSALPETYQYFIPSWQSAPKDERTVSHLTTRLMALERSNKQRENPENDDKVAFKTTKKKDGYKNRKGEKNLPRLKCHLCESESHLVRTCPKNPNIKRCKYCKKQNHKSEHCYFRERYEKREPEKKEKIAYLSHTTNNDTNKCKTGVAFFVDSGLSHHMINDASLLSDFKKGHDVIQFLV
ncbi:unnamed protein product [Arctia plantaginis]|uniref:Uncharacterized protein n=1 Tax=Arctia plantaginis TaxID=874455 RepID=A0A8S0ZGE4_ARCPL|nr:unnamed protein product [Arctia plantaginis]